MDDQAYAVEPEAEDTYEEVQPEATTEEVTDVDNDVDADVTEDDSEEELEEIEFNGKKYAVSKDMKDAFMRQDDYTRKTQEVAETRRQLEQAHKAFQERVEIQQRNLQGYAQVAAIDSQLQQYQQVDWNSLSDEDPVKAQQAYFQYQQLKDTRQAIATQISQAEQTALYERQLQAATYVEQGHEVLAKEIKGWSKELAKDLSKTGIDSYGFTESEMDNVADPRMVKVLHDAYQYRKMMKKAVSKPQAPDVKPVKSIKGKGPARKDPGKMSTAEWMEWRNSQVSRR